MSHTSHPHRDTGVHTGPKCSLRSCIVGFVFSLALTLISYFLVVSHTLPEDTLYIVVISSCVLQVVIQLIYFLHLGDEPKPYWNLLIFGFMILVLVILMAGSLWILYDLNYRGGM